MTELAMKVDAPGASIEVQFVAGVVSIDGHVVSAADAFETAMALARAAISAGHRPPPSFRLPRTPDEEANINEAARLEALILSGDATAEDEATYRDVKARMSPSDDVIQALRALGSGVER